MARLVLINGAPGAGKSTLAEALVRDLRMALALDVDGLKHAMGRWDEDPVASGVQARRLALAVAAEHLREGYDVVMGQYLARTPFVEALEGLAEQVEARFVEVVLAVDARTLADRLALRHSHPDRPEHQVNNGLVQPHEAGRLVESIEALCLARPRARRVDAGGTPEATLDLLRAAVEG